MSQNRSVHPFLYYLKWFARGRQIKQEATRFPDICSARTQPPPDIPGGPYHRLTKIYYYTRDARREVIPPIVVTATKQITSGKDSGELKLPLPGKVHQWDHGSG